MTPLATTVKCMGRTYGTAATDGTIAISDLTDITHPVPLGTARANDTGTWEVHTTRGVHVTRTPDLLQAVAVLRQANWPPRDEPRGR
ncbi:hypothetical protein [Streptantibioticus ferralitis]|uniref:Uncharacterized protein n=1 Tax=Streptantibioticus ferralitis TaxID=236510 RepID=A0ABT5YYP2_9ACTN|nr:hypothetical protein [Streptantibioticus ferralitis]MDF2256718.1 hypothetical protein [Streptantibioticus ferralitis]